MADVPVPLSLLQSLRLRYSRWKDLYKYVKAEADEHFNGDKHRAADAMDEERKNMNKTVPVFFRYLKDHDEHTIIRFRDQ